MHDIMTGYPRERKAEETDLSAVKTLGKALAILDAFAAAERPLTVAEVAVRAGVTRPTAHRLIQTLIVEGYLAQDANDSRITPGYSVLQLAASLLELPACSASNPCRISRAWRGRPASVSASASCTAIKCYISPAWKSLRCPQSTAASERRRRPIARRSARRSSRICPRRSSAPICSDKPLIRHTATTITDEAALRAELAEIRRNGFAVDNEEHAPKLVLRRLADSCPRQAGRGRRRYRPRRWNSCSRTPTRSAIPPK